MLSEAVTFTFHERTVTFGCWSRDELKIPNFVNTLSWRQDE